MKKIIGILSTGVLALAMFLNTNTVNDTNSNICLSSLLSLNTAVAERANLFDSIWKITVTIGTTTTYSCETGGGYECVSPW